MKSIRRDLVLWLAGTLVLGIAAVALATYAAAGVTTGAAPL